jgi:beta-lactamase superfamily II metal-dependent hydrolase
VIRIEMLPAAHGDCLLVEYGDGTEIEGRILLDGGLKSTFKKALAPRLARIGKPCPVELLVVTHVDQDHIEGVLELLDSPDPERIVDAERVWFNGFAEISAGRLGPAQGEDVSKRLSKLPFDWNAGFQRRVVVAPDAGGLPAIDLPGGATLTLLSPGRAQLRALVPVWTKALRDAGLRPGGGRISAAAKAGILGPKKKPLTRIDPADVPALAAATTPIDDAEANGASIAFILEHRRRKVLFGADAHPDVLEEALRRYSGGRGKVRLDAFKLPHHASKHNVARSLLARVACKDFLVSTDGSRFGHPDPEAIARVLVTQRSPRLHFNYRSDYNRAWDRAELRAAHGYEAFYPPQGKSGMTVVVD